MCYITFLTTIKICEGYEFFLDRINLYILSIEKYCEKYQIDYEILICEQVDEKNKFLIGDRLISKKNVRIIELSQTYPNPLGFNLIESYGKNACLREAKGIYCCMNSADQIFSEYFFLFIKEHLKLEHFYRFATYSTPQIDVSELYEGDYHLKLESILENCYKNATGLCNKWCFEDNLTPFKIAQKSGDVMLMDTDSFRKIKGWPETICFTHMDCAVCLVACNNFPAIVGPINACTYTMEQPNRTSSRNRTINVNGINMDVEYFEWKVCVSYKNRTECN